MEWLFIPLAVLAVIVWGLVAGRKRRSRQGPDASRANAAAERQKYDWYGGGR